MNTSVHDDGEEIDNDTFPLSHHDFPKIAKIAAMVRNRLDRMSIDHLHSATTLLFALERLPQPTPGVQIVFGFRTPWQEGNWHWADIEIDDTSLRLGTGSHFYDPAVGGDTESDHVFKSFTGSTVSQGDISAWINKAELLFEEGVPTVQDESEYDGIDWHPDEEE